MKETVFKGVFSAAVAGATAYFHELAIPVMILAVIMAADYVSGMISAWIAREISSRTGIVGIIKKIAYLLAVAVAIVVDWVIQHAAGQIGIDFGGFYFIGLLVTIWLILNECISILENLSEIGVPLPSFLVKLIEKLKKTAEASGDESIK